jgi:hypothetical protein
MDDRMTTTRTNIKFRLQALGAGAAMACVAGLSAPAMAATTASTGHATSTHPASTTTAASTPSKKGVTAAAVADNAIAKLTAPKDTNNNAAQAPAVQAPSDQDLHPLGVPDGQQSIQVSDEQLGNVEQIVKTGKDMNLPPRAQVIAVATAMQESKLHNIGNLGAANDHDSEGLFQQRPSSGWGTPEQITDPGYATWAFLSSLEKVNGWQQMPLTEAAQTVQVSAYPDAYAQWEQQAGDLVKAFYGQGPYADQAKHLGK